MNENFDPFDLSAPPKKQLEDQPPEAPEAKPTVRRISMGPLFHSRITMTLAFILGIVLMFLIGYIVTTFYLAS